MNLSMMKPGERGLITEIGAVGSIRSRLMDMGLISGVEVTLKKVAPLGDPIEVVIKGYCLSLRKKEAEGIKVEVFK